MKGLLYKDNILLRKQLALYLLYFFIAAMMMIVMRISMDHGNLANDAELRASLMRNLYIFRYIPPIVIMLSFTCIPEITVFADNDSGWTKFCLSGPVSNKMIIAEKYIFAVTACVSAYISGIVYVALFCAVSGDRFETSMLRNLTVIFLACLCYLLIFVPAQLILRKKQRVQIFTGILSFIVAAAGMTYTYTLLLELDGMEDIDLLDFLRSRLTPSMDSILIGLAAAVAVIGVAGVLISLRLMKRGEE